MGPPANSEGERVRVRREELCDHRVSGLTFLSKVPALGPGVGNRLAALIVDQLDRAGFGDHINRVPPIVLVGWNVDVPRSSLEESEDHDRHRVIGWSSAWEDISPLRDVRGHWGRWDLAPDGRADYASIGLQVVGYVESERSPVPTSIAGVVALMIVGLRWAEHSKTSARVLMRLEPEAQPDVVEVVTLARALVAGARFSMVDSTPLEERSAAILNCARRQATEFYDGVWPGEEVL